jgi:hypothetical protein
MRTAAGRCEHTVAGRCEVDPGRCNGHRRGSVRVGSRSVQWALPHVGASRIRVGAMGTAAGRCESDPGRCERTGAGRCKSDSGRCNGHCRRSVRQVRPARRSRGQSGQERPRGSAPGLQRQTSSASVCEDAPHTKSPTPSTARRSPPLHRPGEASSHRPGEAPITPISEGSSHLPCEAPIAPTRRSLIAPTRRSLIAPTRRSLIAPTRRSPIAPTRRSLIAPTRRSPHCTDQRRLLTEGL